MDIFLPTKSKIDKVITEEYIRIYGTCYSNESLEHAKVGALTIITWLLNNQ